MRTYGKSLALVSAIAPFNHPLTLLDLQLLQDELKARPDEQRDIVVVCLGKELAVDPWLEDYNKRHPVNQIEVIELRTDQKYGKFFLHQPALGWFTIKLRPNERGMLSAQFARCRVWAVHDTQCRQEWLLIRRQGQQVTYVLSNAAGDTPLETMAWRKSHRYFIERDKQDSKSELGWDEFQATKIWPGNTS